ncbi:acyl carrier protein [Aureimonas leprariae]|nr:acyl carrier protein [Aureimonas leprariae]
MDQSFSAASPSVIGEITSVLQSMLGRPVFLQPDTNIVADLGLDSLAIMDFCMELEDRLDISIPLHQLADVVSVGDLAGAIAQLRN